MDHGIPYQVMDDREGMVLKMILLLDTTKEHTGKQIAALLAQSGRNRKEIELIDTTGLNISHCCGCNYCWLKTPGTCVIKDDYEPILKKMSAANQVWLVSDTKFGFVTWQTKNLIDRIMPLVTMYLHFQGKQMRHVMRYSHNPDFGIVYSGEGDQPYLSEWCNRVAINCGSESLGIYREDQMREAVACM